MKFILIIFVLLTSCTRDPYFMNPLAPHQIFRGELPYSGLIENEKAKVPFCHSETDTIGPMWLGVTLENDSFPKLNVDEKQFHSTCKGELQVGDQHFKLGGNFPGTSRYGMILISDPYDLTWFKCKGNPTPYIKLDLSGCMKMFVPGQKLIFRINRGGGK